MAGSSSDEGERKTAVAGNATQSARYVTRDLLAV